MRSALVAAVLFSLPASLLAQPVPGRVRDADTDLPVQARVEIAGSRVAIATDADGRFTLPLEAACPATAGAAATCPVTLVVSHPGYYVQRLPVTLGATSTIDIRLAAIVSVSDRVEVTASRARDGVDAVSFTNIAQEQVAEAHWGQDPAMLLSTLVPGMYASNDNGNGIGYSYFSIRGFGQARTRVMLNGAPLNDAESGELFFIDLADFLSTGGDVQVQRGVFGLSGLGGAIDITTASPGVSPQLTVHTGAGSFGTRRVSVIAESGLVGGAWSFTGRYSNITTDGYRDQAWADMWNYYVSAARYGQRSRARFVAFGGPEKTHLAYNGVSREVLEGGLTGDAGRDRRFNPITWEGEVDRFFQPHFQFVHDVDVSPATTFSQTAYVFLGDGYYDQYRARRWMFEYDLPGVTLPSGATVSRTDLIRRRNVDEWDAGWVPSLSLTRGRMTYEAQGEARVHRAHHVGEVRWAEYYPASLAANHRYYDYEVAKNTVAAAGEARFAATDRVTLAGGLQVTHHAYEMSNDRLRNVAVSEDFTFLLPRASAVVKTGAGSNVYASVARGMREPFFRSLYDPQDYYAVPVSLDPEDVWNVEAGVSVQRPSWRLRGNVFWMHFLNEIVYAGAVDDNGVPVYGNGATSRHRGIEVDGRVTLPRRTSIDATLSLSRNTFTRYREFDFEGGSVTYDGNRIAGFPDVMASVVARTAIGRGQATLALRHVGRFYVDSSQRDDRQNDAYTLADLSGRIPLPGAVARGVGLGRIEFDVRVNNLFDARYTTFGYVEDGIPLYIPAAGRHVYLGLTLGR
ncbi:MAG: TonB-dependent receptor [Acidobacteria bacterium]|jgi:iron complex outermembrane receptor protein|nr:TonB-dependent receptor [Acidobacteriota bacterium]